MADELLSAAEIEVLTGKRLKSLVAALAPQLAARLEPIHERAARQFAAELSSLLRRTARVRLSGVEAVSSIDFVARLEPAAYCRRIAAAPLAEPWLLSIAPGTLYSIVDCMLGGGRDAQARVRRPPTDIESRLVGRAVKLFLDALQSAWQETALLDLRIIEAEADAPAAGTPPASTLHCTRFALEFAGAQGEMTLGVPAKVVGGLLISPNDRSAARCPQLTDHGQDNTNDNTNTVELVAWLAETEVAPDELAGLAIGDVITTEQSADAPIAVSQDGELKFHARLGSWRGHKAVEIERVLPAQETAQDDPAPGA